MLLGVLALCVAGCTDGDEGGRAEPQRESSSAAATPEQLCSVITPADVQRLLGVERRLDDPVDLGDAWYCDIATDLGDPVEIAWKVHPATISDELLTEVELDPGLPRTTTSIEGTEVTQATGRFAGRATAAQVLRLPGDYGFSVRVTDADESASTEDLAAIATAITTAYLTRPGFVVPPFG